LYAIFVCGLFLFYRTRGCVKRDWRIFKSTPHHYLAPQQSLFRRRAAPYESRLPCQSSSL